MHGDPGKGVVDELGRCHDFDNLYIADTGVFPRCTSVNPMLTGMALAHRTAQQPRVGPRPASEKEAGPGRKSRGAPGAGVTARTTPCGPSCRSERGPGPWEEGSLMRLAVIAPVLVLLLGVPAAAQYNQAKNEPRECRILTKQIERYGKDIERAQDRRNELWEHSLEQQIVRARLAARRALPGLPGPRSPCRSSWRSSSTSRRRRPGSTSPGTTEPAVLR